MIIIQAKQQQQERDIMRTPTNRDLSPQAKRSMKETSQKRLLIYEKDYSTLSHKISHFTASRLNHLEIIVKQKEEILNKLIETNNELKSSINKLRSAEIINTKQVTSFEKEFQQKKLGYMIWIKNLEHKIIENAQLIDDGNQRIQILMTKYSKINFYASCERPSLSCVVSNRDNNMNQQKKNKEINFSSYYFELSKKIEDLNRELNKSKIQISKLNSKVEAKKQETKSHLIKIKELENKRLLSPIPIYHSPDISSVYSLSLETFK